MKEKRAVLGDMVVYWDVYVNGKHFALQKAKLWEAFTSHLCRPRGKKSVFVVTRPVNLELHLFCVRHY